MSAEPLVSVIVNNYNYARFVGEAIESALRQTYRNTEVLVVDDGSTDDSREIILSFGDRIVPVLKDNGGQGSAYNAGFAVSSGNIVCFLDADDVLAPTAIETAIQAFDELDVVKVQWPLIITDALGLPSGELSTKRAPPEGDLMEQLAREGPSYDFDLTTGCAYHRRLLQQIFPMPEPPYRNGADVYLVTVAPVYGRVRNIMQPLGTYRWHDRNNYRGRQLDDARIRNYLNRFETNAAELHRHLRARGCEANPAEWRQRNFNYIWLKRLLDAKQDLSEIMSADSTYILVDGQELGSSELVKDRHGLPFLERHGEYWGEPPDDTAAIAELERMRLAGASFIVFWWTAFWWLDHYESLARHLRQRFDCILESEHLIVFDLLRPPRTDSPASHGDIARTTEMRAQC